MKRSIVALGAVVLLAGSLQAGQSIRVLPRPTPAVDGVTGALVKRMPAGTEFLLTVNKGQDVSYMNIQWFKDGVKIEGETSQELRRPIATEDMNGVYTVEMSSPCATVLSKPIRVVVGTVRFPLNTQTREGSAGPLNDDGTMDEFSLNEAVPNPVSDVTTITFYTPIQAQVVLKLVNAHGVEIATLVQEDLPRGQHSIALNTREHNVAAGVYYYILQAPGINISKPLVVVR
ncbi:MAG: hypothetical protein MUC47_00725 [Candidatus Kapabacteria bacterium]|jgi:hypothetical protein|nr:hypothetical protein [Candidatus Kapabacteria bacterium]